VTGVLVAFGSQLLQSRPKQFSFSEISSQILALPPRVEIPEPIRRIVRQEAGFGCCKCGRWVFEYHHIVPRSEKPEDIMLLCPNCHDEATKDLMLIEEQITHKRNPFNIKQGYAQGTLKANHNVPVIKVGTVELVGEGDFIAIDSEALLSLYINSGRLEVSSKLYDPEGELLAQIERNEWITGTAMPWDIESGYQWLTIRHRKRAIVVDIDLRSTPIKIRADLWHKQCHFGLDSTGVTFDGKVKANFQTSNLCYVGMRFLVNSTSKQLILDPYPFGRGAFVSWPDVDERIKKGVETWNDIKSKSIIQKID
jgi:hypothetical protein